MGLLIPREQWRNRSAWQEYWENFASSDEENLHVDESYLPTTPLLGYGFAREAFQAGLEAKRRILFLSNGISREPLIRYFVCIVREESCLVGIDVNLSLKTSDRPG